MSDFDYSQSTAISAVECLRKIIVAAAASATLEV